MKPYGYETMHYNAKHRMQGDISNGRRPHTRLHTRTALRTYKKIARRNAKLTLQEELNQGDIYA